MKKLLTFAALAMLAATVLFSGPQVSAASVRDCDDNAIVRCGTLTQAELKTKYDENAPGDLDDIYNRYGITAEDINNGQMQMGRVTNKGEVIIDGKVVATNSYSLGRSKLEGSGPININGKTYYQSWDRNAIKGEYADALVIMRDGTFYRAIITACGNPVVATPVVEKQKEPQKEKQKEQQVQPTYACEDLTAKKLARNRYRFTAQANAASGAQVKEYGFGFGDGMGVTTRQNVYDYTYDKPGTYTATVTAYVTVDGKVVEAKGEQCSVEVTVAAPVVVEKEETPAPAQPVTKEEPKQEKPAEIPSTGPGQLIGAGMGVGSLTAAGYYFVRSRRTLLSELLKK